MIDLAKCPGDRCPLRETCVRYTSKTGEYQAWFGTPYAEGACAFYVPVNEIKENDR